MQLRAMRLPYNIVVFEGRIRWPCNCFGVYVTLTSTSQKLGVVVGPQLRRVTTQQTLAAHGCQVQADGEAVPGHKAKRKPGLLLPCCSPKQQLVAVYQPSEPWQTAHGRS